MNAELAKITARYSNRQMTVSTSNGGIYNDKMIELRMPLNKDYVQFNRKQVKELVTVLNSWLDQCNLTGDIPNEILGIE